MQFDSDMMQHHGLSQQRGMTSNQHAHWQGQAWAHDQTNCGLGSSEQDRSEHGREGWDRGGDAWGEEAAAES